MNSRSGWLWWEAGGRCRARRETNGSQLPNFRSQTVIDWRGYDAKQSLDTPHFQRQHRNCEDISNGTLLSRRAEGRADVANTGNTQRCQPCDLQGLPWWLLADQDSPEHLKLRRSGCLHKFASFLLVRAP